MAGIINGRTPRLLNSSTMARMITAILATPRLPAVTATVCPGFSRVDSLRFEICSETFLGMSVTCVASNFCSTRTTFGKDIGTPLKTETFGAKLIAVHPIRAALYHEFGRPITAAARLGADHLE